MTALATAIKDNSTIKMTEDQFWIIVDAIGWGYICNTARSYVIVRKNLGKDLSLKKTQDLRAIMSLACNLLDKFIGLDRNPAGGSDDSHNDLISHIIGLGKVKFYACLSDYNLIASQEYKESFSYCLPYEEDILEGSLSEEDDGKFEFEVMMQATIVKKIKVREKNSDDAIMAAYELFSSENDGTAEKYKETWLDCQKAVDKPE